MLRTTHRPSPAVYGTRPNHLVLPDCGERDGAAQHRLRRVQPVEDSSGSDPEGFQGAACSKGCGGDEGVFGGCEGTDGGAL